MGIETDPDVSEETRQQVRAVAHEMGYRPNAIARSLKIGRTFNLGVLYSDDTESGFTHSYFSPVLQSFKQEAERRMENTRLNLSRVEDILTELSDRLEPLREQSQTAREYLQLRDELKGLELNAFLLRSDRYNERLEALKQSLESFSESVAQSEAEQARLTDRRDQLNDQLSHLEERAAESREEVQRLIREVEAREGAAGRVAQGLGFVYEGHIGTALQAFRNDTFKAALGLAKELCSYAAQNDTYRTLVLVTKYERDRESFLALLWQLDQLCSAVLRRPAYGAEQCGGLTPDRAARILQVSAATRKTVTGNGNLRLAVAVFAAEAAR